MPIISDEKFEEKLWDTVNKNKPKTIIRNGKKYYISRKIIDEIKNKQIKDGGIFPLIPILAGIAAAGSVAGGAAGIAKAVQDKKANDARLAQEKAHDDRVEQLLKGEGMFLPEYQKGNGFSEGIKAFVDKTGLDDFGKKLLRKTLKPLSDKLNIIVKGNGLILMPK